MDLTLLQLIYGNACLPPYSVLVNNKGNRETVRDKAKNISQL